MKKNLDVQILVDKDSWVVPFSKKLSNELKTEINKVQLITSEKNIKKGDILFILSWEKLLKEGYLDLHKHNLVVHASDLPKGKGWSPLTWQILEGKNKISITLFEAEKEVDSGDIYFQDKMFFRGDELIDGLRKQMGEKTIELALKFIKAYPNVKGKKQKGKGTYYKRRTPKDSEIDIRSPIIKIFNKFRIADNERYPVSFNFKGNKYILKIYKEKSEKK